MLEIFVASVLFKALIQQYQDISMVQNFSSILEVAAKDKSKTLLPVLCQTSTIPTPLPCRHQMNCFLTKIQPSSLLYHTEHSSSQVLSSYVSYSKHTWGKVTFTTSISFQHDCNVAYTTNNTQWVDIIWLIVAAPQDILLIVEWYMPLALNSAWNPFTLHANFCANLWAEKTKDN